MRRSVLGWLCAGSLLGALRLGCSFPEHDFIPADEFEKLRHDASAGGFGGAAGAGGGSGGGGGVGGSAAAGGTSGNAGASGVGGAAGAGGIAGASGGGAGSGGVSGTGGDAGSGGSAAMGGTGGNGGSSGSGGTSGSGGSSGACSVVVINELSTDGPNGGTDEFVELYNAGTCSVSLTGWTLKYSAASATSPSTRWTGAGADALAPGGFFVVGGAGFAGAKQGTLTSGLAVTGGGIGIYDDTGVRVDSIAYEVITAATHPHTETTPAANIPGNKSASRIPDGSDTDNNALDFDVPATRTPGAANTL